MMFRPPEDVGLAYLRRAHGGGSESERARAQTAEKRLAQPARASGSPYILFSCPTWMQSTGFVICTRRATGSERCGKVLVLDAGERCWKALGRLGLRVSLRCLHATARDVAARRPGLDSSRGRAGPCT